MGLRGRESNPRLPGYTVRCHRSRAVRCFSGVLACGAPRSRTAAFLPHVCVLEPKSALHSCIRDKSSVLTANGAAHAVREKTQSEKCKRQLSRAHDSVRSNVADNRHAEGGEADCSVSG